MQTSLKLNSLINGLFVNKSNTLIWGIAVVAILGGCSPDLEDERFELIPGTFPKLVDVPDRPIHPDMSAFDEMQKKLLAEREMAYKSKEKNFEQLKK